ncbi:tetratricopeptide repeat protein [Arsukibacterium perlucidum]|uniref:tetratricopeptide repeat protein n=1 Tax=Arsukibacterium perlucidum TaxID=368811 RepID=UPI000363D7DA|nr:tetratricopeptide repeat protein [Arsukibacterium perlucidum]
MKLTKLLIDTGHSRAGNKTLRLAAALLMLLSLSHCAQLSQQDSVTADLPETATEQPPPLSEPTAAPESAVAALQDKPTLPPGLQTRFQQAKQLIRNEDYQAALTLLVPLAQSVPDAAGIHYNLALCYWQLQLTEQARQQLTALVERQPDYIEATNLLGIIARQAGNFNQARRYWLDALERNNDFASAHKNLGFLYELYLAQPEQARYHYQQYQQLTADPMAEAWLSLLEQQE